MKTSSNNCPFCQIIKGKISTEIIYENKNTLTFLDINSLCHEHVLVTLKK